MQYISNKLSLAYSIYYNLDMFNSTLNTVKLLNKYSPTKLLKLNNTQSLDTITTSLDTTLEYTIKPNKDNLFPISNEIKNKFNNKYYIHKLIINCKSDVKTKFKIPCNCVKNIIYKNLIELYLLPSFYEEDYIIIHILNKLFDVSDITITLKYYPDKIYVVSYFNKIIFSTDYENETYETLTNKLTVFCNKDKKYKFNDFFNIEITNINSDYWKSLLEFFNNISEECFKNLEYEDEKLKKLISRLIEKNNNNIISIINNASIM